MKTIKGIKLTALLTLLLGFGMLSNSYAQTTSWIFDAADNSGWMVQIKTTGSDHEITKVNLGKKGDANWGATQILKIGNYDSYIRIKSSSSGRVYELNIEWYDGKLVMTRPEGNDIVYWLRN